MLMEYRLFSMLLTSFGVFMGLAALEVAAATQSEFSFAAGTDSSGWAQARSNSEGRVMIESPEYPRGLWLNLVDKSGQALAGLEVEYQGRPDSLVVLRCVDPAGLQREALLWTRSAGEPILLALKPSEADDLPAGLTFVDWHIDPSAESLLEPVAEARLNGWEAVTDFLRERWQGRTGRVAVHLDTITSLAFELGHPEIIESLVAHLQQAQQSSGAWAGENTTLVAQVLEESFDLRAGVVLFTSLFEDSKLEEQVKKRLSLGEGPITLQEVAFTTSLTLDREGIQSLAGLEHFTALQELSLLSNRIADVKPLAHLANLERLILASNRIADVNPLASLNNLNELHLGYNQIRDVSPLANLTNLERLNLDQNRIADVNPLASLNNLNELHLGYNQIRDVSPLANLTNLERLNLRHNQIADVNPLANLTNLKELGLDHNQIADVSPLANLNNLKQLFLRGNQFAEVKSLANLNDLKALDLQSNQIADVNPLASLTYLHWLHLRYNQIRDVSPLANLTNLKGLELDHNQIADVSPLANLTNLKWLHLDHNQIADVSPLANLTYLQRLDLQSNQIADVNPLANLAYLHWLDLNQNLIIDVNPLVANPGLGKGDVVYLEGNPLSHHALNEQIPALKARGVRVRH